MTKTESFELARDIKEELKCYGFNNPQTPYYTLKEFELDGQIFNLYVSVWKGKDDDGHKYYAVWSGVEFDGGDNVWGDYEYSTNSFTLSELADNLYKFSHYYDNEDNKIELRKMIEEG